MSLPTFTIDDIRDWKPCYDPTRYLPEGWTGTALDILAIEDCPIPDRFWVVLREKCIGARTLRLFAVWCAREALKLVDNPDPRSISACNVAERHANGEATDEELAASGAASWAAARDAGKDASGAASWAAARDAARAAAQTAARDAARDAAWDAAGAAARDAAWAAARAAVWDATRDAARDARAAARAAQLNQLVKMLEAQS